MVLGFDEMARRAIQRNPLPNCMMGIVTAGDTIGREVHQRFQVLIDDEIPYVPLPEEFYNHRLGKEHMAPEVGAFELPDFNGEIFVPEIIDDVDWSGATGVFGMVAVYEQAALKYGKDVQILVDAQTMIGRSPRMASEGPSSYKAFPVNYRTLITFPTTDDCVFEVRTPHVYGEWGIWLVSSDVALANEEARAAKQNGNLAGIGAET